jgi:DNA-binding beta-propeller fold protein YncE
VPGLLGWRLIAGYAALPTIVATPEREVRLALAGEPPISGGWGIAVTPTGGIYLADQNNKRLLWFPDGTSASGTVLARGLSSPYDLALAPDGALDVLDFLTGSIDVYRDGRPAGSLGRFPGARALAAAADGSVFVADTAAGRVIKLGSFSAWSVGQVIGLAATSDGLYASTPAELLRLDALGHVGSRQKLVGEGGPLAPGPNGAVYQSELAANRVWASRDGRLARVLGPGGRQDLFFQPRGLFIRGDELYVVNENRVGVYRLPIA